MRFMASVNKIRIGDNVYDISISPTGTMDTTSANRYVSSDVAQTNATTWTSVEPILVTDNHKTIFTKLTQMIKNVRYLFNLFGTGFTTTKTITSVVNSKANKNHSHTVAQIPTSNSYTNSTSSIPTSALVYQLNSAIPEAQDRIEVLQSQLG